jgi:hypothetical protein
MSAPAKAKKSLESVVGLKQLNSSAGEATQAARLMRSVADDSEVSLDLRATASQHAGELSAQPTSEDSARRDAALMRAISTARSNI